MFKWNTCVRLCPLFLILTLGITEKSLFLLPLLRASGTRINPHEPLFLQAGQPQLSQHFLIRQMLQSLTHLYIPLLDSLQYVHVLYCEAQH